MSETLTADDEVQDVDTDLGDGGEFDHADRVRDRRRLRLTIGLTLITLGLALVLFLAYLFAFTSLQAQRKQRQLLNVFTTPAGAVALSGALPKAGAPTAILTIPAIGLDQVVVQGTSPVDLAGGPGAMPQTARLGTKGNAVIAGRRFTAGAPFARLDELKRGDKIKVVTGLGSFKYRLIHPAAEVAVGDEDPASPTRRSQLTLLTSSSMTGGGRTFVVAKLMSSPASAARPVHPPTAAELGVAGQAGAQASAIVWGILLIMSLVASIIAYQRSRGKVLMVYVLTTPIVLAIALMFYSQLYKLLPSMI